METDRLTAEAFINEVMTKDGVVYGYGHLTAITLAQMLEDFAAKREAERAKQITQLQNSAGFCEKHPPGNGHRRCLVCGCIELSFALSQIDYAIGEPNEMGVSTYDVFPYPDTVVDRVKNKVAEQAAEIERLRGALEDMRDHGIRFDLQPTMNHKSGPHDEHYQKYLTRIDESIRQRARTALGKEAVDKIVEASPIEYAKEEPRP